MKICPTCRKTYQDDNLNFCLEDGSVLTIASNEPAPTVMMSQPRPTDPSPVFGAQPDIRSSYGNSPQYAPQGTKKSSKTWLWILGIVGILLLLCGGGGVAGLIFLASQADVASNNSTPPNPPPTNKGSTLPGKTPGPSNTSGPTGNVENIDLAMFVQKFSIYGTTEMSGDELLMAAKQKRYYYVLVAPDDYSTADASVSVTVRNVDNADSSLGYGLIFHSDPQPLTKDYAFLVDAKKKRFRVVRHDPSNETSVVGWKNSTAINDGSQENKLEVRDKGGDIDLYINDQLVTSIKDTYGHPNGVPGLYSGDGVKVAFKKLEIRK